MTAPHGHRRHQGSAASLGRQRLQCPRAAGNDRIPTRLGDTMFYRVATAMTFLIASACTDASTAAQAPGASRQANSGFEVWILDQSGTQPATPNGYGGTLHIFEGSSLMGGSAASATPIASIDLAPLKDGVCAATGKNPVRPHMILFNKEFTHGIMTFVASGHVVIWDAERREPLSCFLMSQSPTGQQAHAAFPAPDGSYIVVSNQSGKRLERIDTNYETNTFVHNAAA